MRKVGSNGHAAKEGAASQYLLGVGAIICYRPGSRRDFCFPHGTKEFCQPPFCEKDFTENRRACSHSPSSVCPGPGELIEQANNVCKKKQFIAIKTIRMTLIQEFIPYFRDDTNDLDPYFIFLVRDPRGLMNSRLRIARVQYHEKDEKKFHEIASKVEGKFPAFSYNFRINNRTSNSI